MNEIIGDRIFIYKKFTFKFGNALAVKPDKKQLIALDPRIDGVMKGLVLAKKKIIEMTTNNKYILINNLKKLSLEILFSIVVP